MSDKAMKLRQKMESISAELDPINTELMNGLFEFKEILTEMGKDRGAAKVESALKILSKLQDDRYNPPVIKKNKSVETPDTVEYER